MSKVELLQSQDMQIEATNNADSTSTSVRPYREYVEFDVDRLADYPLRHFKHHVGQLPVIIRDGEKALTRDQEVHLAKRIEKHDMWAKDQMIECNMKLLIKTAHKRGRNLNDHDLLDLIQNGSVGLIRAVEKFDWRKGFKFSSYAVWWIEQAMDRGSQKSDTVIKLPEAKWKAYRKIRKTEEKFIQKKGYEPSLDDLSELLKKDSAEIQYILDVVELARTSSTEVAEVNGQKVKDVIVDPVLGPSIAAVRAVEKESLKAMRARCLSDEEDEVLDLKFGLNEGSPGPLNNPEIAKRIGKPKKTVEKIGDTAVKKLHLEADSTRAVEV